MASAPYIGSKLSLVSNSDIRYEGILYTINTQESTIALKSVRCCGTQGRRSPEIPPSSEIYDFIIFRGQDIKDLTVLESASAALSAQLNDPAIMSVNQRPAGAPPPTSSAGGAAGYGGGGGGGGGYGGYGSGYSGRSGAGGSGYAGGGASKGGAGFGKASAKGSGASQGYGGGGGWGAWGGWDKSESYKGAGGRGGSASYSPGYGKGEGSGKAGKSMDKGKSMSAKGKSEKGTGTAGKGKGGEKGKDSGKSGKAGEGGGGRRSGGDGSGVGPTVGELIPQVNEAVKNEYAEDFDYQGTNEKFSKVVKDDDEGIDEKLKPLSGYDKGTSFFDNISCEATERAGDAERPKVDRNKARQSDRETFGDTRRPPRPAGGRRGGKGGARRAARS
eukprot:CAMPEP_0117518382 /NCGR_PEP_ID=MMETSP0784-20121206/32102_1 /TAXON_ID=39447 /ORGANISM="" /LENGTH=387 /DNA_ID=CAMNT_0005314299 /DNA_START=52 /DNA_END=1215 /DNA_ORIENTATION=+